MILYLFLAAIIYDFFVFQVLNSHISLIFSIMIGLLLVSYFYFKRNLRDSEKLLILFIITVWFVFQISLIGSVEYQYQYVVEDYKQEYADTIDTGNYTALSASWLLAEKYCNGMDITYGQKGVTLPNRALSGTPISIMLLGVNPCLAIYFSDFTSRNKLIFLQNAGNCGEFARAIAIMLEDASSMNTRVIKMEGADHEFPEVYYEGEWWVFDKTYTTSISPVRARDYATHLEDRYNYLHHSIANLKVANEEISVLEEHGFDASNVTISALFDTISYSEPDTPLSYAEIKVYAITYTRDSIVFTGKTDVNGKCNLILNGDKEYVIVGNYDMYNGIKIVNTLPSKDELVILLLC
ncbi:hypothetical protein SZ63_02355 [Methanoculleus sediminis]|uniref:Transglutaminase-like domain-containing protein n=1 Tax=Methanoculleus sediminis TaxID=1550566 RepID=A0A0H1R3E5_9EURY|nr:hypothetical protein SZ63_02355 [Methanoculleus sediminis]